MKKLLVAAIGAAAAIGAFADPYWYSGTSFETLDAGTNVLETAEGANWQTIGDSTLTVRDIEAEWNAKARPTRASYFENNNGVDALTKRAVSIKTKFGEPAYRESDTTKTMGEVYVDVFVKPTICEDDPTTIGNDAKIAIWLKETESPAATNLMITAGYIDSEGQVVQTNYNCGTYGTTFTDGAADDWQRFTIKSFATVKDTGTWPAFVVFRNGIVVGTGSQTDKCDGALFDDLVTDAAAYHRYGNLFPSLSTTSTNISAIGFDGTGDVDDILFTDEAPSWATTKKITLAWDSNVTNFTYTIGGASKTLSNLSGQGSVEIAVDVQADIVISNDGYSEGFEAGTFTSSDLDITVSGKTFTLGTLSDIDDEAVCTIVSKARTVYMTVNGKSCYSVAEAIEEVSGTTGPATLSLSRAIALEDAITFGSETLTGVTLDLNGKALTYSGEGYAITASKPLTIIDSATGGSITANGVVTNTTGLLTISAGTFNGKVAIGGTAAITGGTFTGDVAAESATGFITGGEFAYNYTTAGYIADGYEVKGDTGHYTVVEVVVVKKKIEYYDDDGVTEITGLEPAEYVVGQPLSASLPTPVKAGYVFVCWLDENDEPFVYNTSMAEDLALIASWTPVAVPTFTLTAAPGANMTVAVYTNDVVGVVGVNDDYTIASNDTAKIVYTAVSGYKIEGQDTYTTNIVVEANVTVTAPTASASVTPIDPDQGGEQTYDSDAAATAAANAINNDKEHLIAVDDSVTGEAKTTYLSKVEAVASGTKVTIQFTAAAEAEVQAQADADNAALPLANVAAAATSAEATVAATPGCYYTVESGTTPGALTPGTPVLATGTTVTLTIPNKGDAGFYKIKVTPTK